MPSYARVQLLGNLGREPETKYTAQGTQITNFSLAVNRRVKTGDEWLDETSWFAVSCFGRQAEYAAGLLKGGLVEVHGRLQPRLYVGRDGTEKLSLDVVATELFSFERRERVEVPAAKTDQVDLNADLPF